jgi:hypothetical protein
MLTGGECARDRRDLVNAQGDRVEVNRRSVPFNHATQLVAPVQSDVDESRTSWPCASISWDGSRIASRSSVPLASP